MIAQGDARHIPLANETAQCVVTSPPYWGLRDYGLVTWQGGDPQCQHRIGSRFDYSLSKKQRSNAGSTGQYETHTCRVCGAIRHDAGIGLEPTLEEYVANIVQVFREVWRVLRPDGTVWCNMGDSYAGTGYGKGTGGNAAISHPVNKTIEKPRFDVPPGLKPKDLVGLPWRVAFALQAEDFYLRSDIIWAKPNPMPESVRDRPTKSHEHLFLLTKSTEYFYDAEAIKETTQFSDTHRRGTKLTPPKEAANADIGHGHRDFARYTPDPVPSRNRRDVWTISTAPFKGAHFATFPPKLVEPCILAGTSPKACGVCGAPWGREIERKANYEKRETAHAPNNTPTKVDSTGWKPPTVTDSGWRPTCDHDDDTGKCLVLDPFCGSGTVGKVALEHGRRFVGMDLSAKYLELARERMRTTMGMAL